MILESCVLYITCVYRMQNPNRRDDVFTAISAAKRFILITGWSVWVDTCLKRSPASEETSPPLGELLLKKAGEGVKVRHLPQCLGWRSLMQQQQLKDGVLSVQLLQGGIGSHLCLCKPTGATPTSRQVLMLVWDDASNNLGLHPGLMATHDQETFKYFKGTAVKCVLCPRQGGTEDSIMQVGALGCDLDCRLFYCQLDGCSVSLCWGAPSPTVSLSKMLIPPTPPSSTQAFTRNSFTHHQKTILVDAPPPRSVPRSAHPDVRNKRHVVAFIGGLDLCDGRWVAAWCFCLLGEGSGSAESVRGHLIC